MFYCNDTANTKPPLGILYILTMLKDRGHLVHLFDNSKYRQEKEYNDHEIRGNYLNFEILDLEPYGVKYQKVTPEILELDILNCLNNFKPDIIGISITEDTSRTGLYFASLCKKYFPKIKVILGGVYCSTMPEKVIENIAVDMLCVGEGEVVVAELLERLEKNESIDNIPNLWIKKDNGEIIKNKVMQPTPLDFLPFPDLSLIDDSHLFAPFAGHVYKMSFIESQRGCPRECSYCCNTVFLNAYKEYGVKYLRRKSVTRLIDEIEYLVKEFGLNFIQFTDDDFLLRPIQELQQFSVLYKNKINLPFWIQAEAWNATDEKVKLVHDAGCIAVSMGIETGNEYILKKIMKRNTPREKTIQAFKTMHKYNIRTSGNIIIGVPEETRSSIFDTIDLVRECNPASINSAIFIPYNGLQMRTMAIAKGYLKDSYCRDLKDSWKAVLTMPQISSKEIEDLARVFVLYCVLPKSDWDKIGLIEKYPTDNDDVYQRLKNKCWELMKKRGINVSVPSIDYDDFLNKRIVELSSR